MALTVRWAKEEERRDSEKEDDRGGDTEVKYFRPCRPGRGASVFRTRILLFCLLPRTISFRIVVASVRSLVFSENFVLELARILAEGTFDGKFVEEQR